MDFELYEMVVDLPFLRKGLMFLCDEQTGMIYGCETDGRPMMHPIREGLRGYIWLLMTQNEEFIKWVERNES